MRAGEAARRIDHLLSGSLAEIKEAQTAARSMWPELQRTGAGSARVPLQVWQVCIRVTFSSRVAPKIASSKESWRL